MAGAREEQDAATLEAVADAAWVACELDECIAARDPDNLFHLNQNIEPAR